MSRSAIRALLVDGHAAFQPLAFLLGRAPWEAVVRQAGSLAEARRALAAGLRPDIAVVDLDLPDGDGADLVRELRRGGTRVLALAGEDDLPPRAFAVAAGGVTALPRSAPLAALLETVRRLAAEAAGSNRSAAPRRVPNARVPPHPARPCRVEHRIPGGASMLGRLDACVPHHSTLAPFASQLRLAGRATGELVLVDEASGAVLARRRLAGR